MALEFRNRMRTDLKVTVQTAQLLLGPTLETLADDISSQMVATSSSSKVETKFGMAAMEYPLSFGQQSQWFGHKLIPGSSTFNVGFTATISPHLDWPSFERAVARLVERHPGMRTTIVEIEPGRRATCDCIGHSRPEPGQRGGLDRRTTEDTGAGGVSGRLCHRPAHDADARLPDKRKQRHLYVFCRSSDRGCIIVNDLLRSLREYYGAEIAGTQASVKPLSADYSDFVSWETTLAGYQSERLCNFWSRKLGGDLPVLTLPSSRPRPDVLLPKGESVGLSFGPDLSAAVHKFAREHRATSYSVLLASYFILLKMYCCQDDIVVGTSVSQRDDERWTNVVGFFVNVLPLRVKLSGDPIFTEHLAHVRTSVLEGLAHHELPFPVLVNRLALPRTMRHSPVFQAFLNFLQDRGGDFGGLVTPGGDTAIRFGDATLRPFMVIPQEDGRSEIALHIGQNEDLLPGNLNYNGDVLDSATAEAMAASYLEILENVVQHPDWPIGEIIAQAGLSGEREELML